MIRKSNVPPAALIATMGGKPQVVTFALDALLNIGSPVERVCVVHLSTRDPRIQRALDVLHADFRVTYGRRSLRLDSVPIHAVLPGHSAQTAVRGRPIDSVDEPDAPEAIWMTLHRLIATLRAEGYRIEMCVTGGPRLIALQALSVAALLLTPQDRCWHLYTPPALRDAAGEGRILHVTPDVAPNGETVYLVPVPVLPLGLWIPGLQQAAFQSPDQILSAGRQWLSAQDEERCREVLGRLTQRQRDVLRVFADGAMTVREAAQRLHVSVHTINSHLNVIRQECRNAWGLSAEDKVDARFLCDHFGSLKERLW
ncbi:MAG: CRISPR-associated ring nuclease [Anaerolineae bacterium]|nr:CRISPR-associated ring nuclease [Thermoflexales bacterium]MDW8408318.1 CRISPR-associated ring nuclease [Anaerolineae bacterium]